MNIHISNISGKALYEQIYDQIKNQILEGTLEEGQPLPTIRGLAKDLRISVITTSRAYSDLERDGYICSVVGKGTFVAERNGDFVKERNLKELEEHILKSAEIAERCRMTEEQFLNMVKTICRGRK
ncbi:MAG TPA: GntR family transcriptional regulator [Candidatus Coproplasma stercoripullorum]|uniref:GntR family transcriptional regulator n=1 Tax=Candidatus Coproplasma stercoripullorum TaxID=2840751 RepID=A0A9D1AE56_9FIRM|nr:GntR family transcriptional regulator [Candidatus Coproplasma stercoripullorum]